LGRSKGVTVLLVQNPSSFGWPSIVRGGVQALVVLAVFAAAGAEAWPAADEASKKTPMAATAAVEAKHRLLILPSRIRIYFPKAHRRPASSL